MPRFLIDVGHYWQNQNRIYAGIEWQYWHNKAGGTETENVPQLQLKWVF